MPRRLETFEPGYYYHLYNRGVNRGPIYFNDKNFQFFLFNIERYLLPVMELMAYCLMPTHYHMLIRIRDTSEVGDTSEVDDTSEVPTAMMKLSVSYTKAINSAFNRVGPLFQGAYQSKVVDSDAYLWQLIDYIHMNPVQSELVSYPEHWIYSSYYAYREFWPDDPEKFDPNMHLRGLSDLGGLPYLGYNRFIRNM